MAKIRLTPQTDPAPPAEAAAPKAERVTPAAPGGQAGALAEQPKPQTTSLAARLLTASADEQAKMLSSSKFLPTFKLMHPIDQPELGLGGCCVIATDGQTQRLAAPFRLCVLGVRYAARKLETQADGSKKYVRGFQGGKSQDQYEKLATESRANGDRNMLGKSALVAVITGEGPAQKVAICSVDMFATGGAYWEKAFAAGLFASKCCVKVAIENHLGNLKSSPKDKTKNFFAREKFRQWQPEELTEDTAKLIKAACEAAGEGVEDWANK